MFTLTIETDNAAFHDADDTASRNDEARALELARILRALAQGLETAPPPPGESGHLRDLNGNRCGAWSLGAEPQPAPPARAPLAALSWMIFNEVEQSSDRLPELFSSDPGAAQRELRDVRAAVDWLEACGEAVEEHRGAMLADALEAEILAWTPSDPPPGYAVFQTPSGRWAYERDDGQGAGVGYRDRDAAVSGAKAHAASVAES